MSVRCSLFHFRTTVRRSYFNALIFLFLSVSSKDLIESIQKHQNLKRLHLEDNDMGKFNTYLTNGFAHHYHLGESTFILEALGAIKDFYIIFQ